MADENVTNRLLDPVSREIVTTALDMSVDYAELPLDSFLEDGILKEIPFVKTFYAVFKIGTGLRECWFAKKFLTFLKEFHSGTIQPDKLSEFKIKFNDDEKYRHKITESLIIYNEAFLQVEKSKILAKFFAAHIEGHFDWDHFNHLSASLNIVHPKIFSFLEELSAIDFVIPEDRNEDQKKFDLEALVLAGGLGYDTSPWGAGFELSQMGKDFYNFGLK